MIIIVISPRFVKEFMEFSWNLKVLGLSLQKLFQFFDRVKNHIRSGRLQLLPASESVEDSG